MTVSALCLLAGCGASTSVERPLPPPSLTAPAPGPAPLPERDLTATEVEVFWGRDRSNLRMCVGQLGDLSDWSKSWD